MARIGSLRRIVNRAKDRTERAKTKAINAELAARNQKQKVHGALSQLDAELQRPRVYTDRKKFLLAYNESHPGESRFPTAGELIQRFVRESKKLQKSENRRAKAEVAFEASENRLARAKRLRSSRLGKAVRIATGGPKLWKRIKTRAKK
ncbi:MAG: hypothetical protein PHH08_02555 [Candidatus ainarchaeum sp.]|nr:hypothetical protein [Candidatus ainarchaeum sp.]